MSSRFSFVLISIALTASVVRAQTVPAPPANPSGPVVELDRFVITGQLDETREAIVPSLGATAYLFTPAQIDSGAQGANAPFDEILLRAPGVAGDSAPNGDLHVRGEHANLQYRINDVLLPEGIAGFGLELDPRFVDTMQLITGSLPAQFGFRTAGVVDIHTKNGALASGGEVSVSGGSFDTFHPAFEAGGSVGSTSYFVDGGYERNALGLESPTSSSSALHDLTEQRKVFGYFSRLLDDSSRFSLMVSAAQSDYQVPNTPGLAAGTSPGGTPWVAGTFDSARLDENQREQNDYAIAAYQKSAGDLNYQVSAFGRVSEVNFVPDIRGDLFFNGVASNVSRQLRSAGLQFDASYAGADAHTWRGGFSLLHEAVAEHASTTVFPVDDDGDATGPSFVIGQQERLHGLFAGIYLQDEWKLGGGLTLNYGARGDVFRAGFDDEAQLSPRLNFTYQVSGTTTLHAGYARYFTPPPVENVPAGTVAQFAGTSNASALGQDDPVRSERADYFDAGISWKIGRGFQVGLDGYSKRARNQLDDGLFGQTLILSAFNYAEGEVYGVELTSSYTRGAFSAYANLARSVAKGKDWNSAQFLFDPADLAYVKDHWIFLDHDQSLTGSAGLAFRWPEGGGGALAYVEARYGSGLRNDATAPDGSTIPNGASVPAYATINLGVEHRFKAGHHGAWRVRVDVVNLADKSYELRDGSGVGVNAAQFGPRRGFYGSVGYRF